MQLRGAPTRYPAPIVIGVLTLLTFLGFAPTFYLRPYFNGPPLTSLFLVHGAVFSVWLLLLVTQSALVRTNRVQWHRRLGLVGGAFALAMIPLGIAVALQGAADGTAAARAGIPPLTFMIIPLGQILIFGALVIAAICWRRDRDTHVRLMLVATLNLIAPAIARLIASVTGVLAPPAVGVTLLILLAACASYDWVARRRVHAVFAWVGPLTVVMFPLRIYFGHSAVWLRFASWLVDIK